MNNQDDPNNTPAPGSTPNPDSQPPTTPDQPAAQETSPFPVQAPAGQPSQHQAPASPFPSQQTAPAPGSDDPGRTLGIVGLILAFLIPLAGLIVSIIARSKSKAAGFKNTLATVGIWVNAALLLLGLLIIGLFLAAVPAIQEAARETERRNEQLQVESRNAEMESDAEQIAAAAQDELDARGTIPYEIDELDVSREVLEDPKGNTYQYSLLPNGCGSSLRPCTGIKVSSLVEDFSYEYRFQ